MLLCLLCEGLLTTFHLSSQAVCHFYRQQTFGCRFDVGSSARFDAVFCAYLRSYNVGQKSFLIVSLCHTAYNKSY